MGRIGIFYIFCSISWWTEANYDHVGILLEFKGEAADTITSNSLSKGSGGRVTQTPPSSGKALEASFPGGPLKTVY